ncbi:MAG: tRNA (N6-threonylcarbamoyladenosine(37)-N6)-methyltransferase TrmO [Bacteroidales bacterium]|nr:tRNA (N6-threonylcarbamoyladenosine(37)-N6)-methyltransferase TrmO [Bacteroidales bacterium]
MKQIAHIETPFRQKFGVPRQAGLVDCEGRVVFEPEYRVAEAVRGLEEFDYVWLIWKFHLNGLRDGESSSLRDGETRGAQDLMSSGLEVLKSDGWSPTVRPPRLGGNKRVGVFATRSPFRPNAIGLSSVRLLRVAQEPGVGPVLYVGGADLVDGTPIFDIKPYVAYADAHPQARSGFAQEAPSAALGVVDDHGLLLQLPEERRNALVQTLAHDPRPHYQHDPQRVYAFFFDRWEVLFRVGEGCVEVVDVRPEAC